MDGSTPLRLSTRFLEKESWGAQDLAPWYPSPEKKIGEVWFEADIPLLVKFLFTSDRLSVQVHPDDAFAALHEKSLGKTEMWYVLRADPGAQLAIGFRETLTRDRLRESALSGEIVNLLNWISVEAGHAFFLPAGTVHAIGPGLALCEIQQNSDVTYRLYDYGRPRELHLEKALQVASLAASRPKPVMLPIDCQYFHTELARIASPIHYVPAPDRFHILIFVSGMGEIAGQPFREGEAWLIPAGASRFQIRPADPVKFLRTWIPAASAPA
ncbi:MAG TPA: class I mannose-6-phosphate isomerase [Bryobacteraceae bacterium]|nr:class I mannose-6-phosphate isomerase [Bryobacteraceae bacterium]